MKKPTVTIAVCAYNESRNILPFLSSVLSQTAEGFTITKILVISDGSTDDTEAQVNSLHQKKIIVKAHKARKGKSLRLNEIYQHLDTDFLIQSDADVVFSHRQVVRDLVLVLVSQPHVGMCGGNPLPMPAQTFVETAVNSTVAAYVQLRSKVRSGNNPFSADGRLLAFRKEFVSKIRIPHDMIANDRFCYYACKQNGWEYRFVKTAVVSFRSPQTFRDQLRQNTRFVAAPRRMQRYFPKELISREEAIPVHLQVGVILEQFVAHPVGLIMILIINRYCQLKAMVTEHKLTAQWDIATSTKHV